MSLPLITVVTVCYNCRKDLEFTIQSVISQDYDNIEYIIIDGGSNDGSVDIIKTFKDKISFWVSEKDDGIYWAMNKGMSYATGDYLIFINAGDKFYSETTISTIFKKPKYEDIVFGKSITKYKDTTCIRYESFGFDSKKWFNEKMPNHQAVFISKKIYSSNKFDTNLTIFSDFDFLIKAFNKYSYKYVDTIVSEFELGGISNYYAKFSQLKRILKDDRFLKGGISKSYLSHIFKFLLQQMFDKDKYLSLYISRIVKK